MRPVCYAYPTTRSRLNPKAKHTTKLPTKWRIIPSLWGKKPCFMLNLTKHETDHAHKYPNINNYWHSYIYFHDGAQRQNFKHYSYHAQWHKDEHENCLTSPSKVWNISLYLVVNTLNVIWVCVVESGILGKVKSGILNTIVLKRIIDQN